MTFETEMSDGPHRSLPMPPGWKRFAERAYKPAFSVEEIREALPAALERDWQEENMPGFVAELRELLFGSQPDFFCDQAVKLEGLRKAADGSPFRCAFMDYAIQVATKGHSGGEGCIEAVRQALSDRVARGARQVEEHYYRQERENNVVDVRRRVENAIAGLDVAAVARRLCGIDRNEQARRLTKRTALDDGVAYDESQANLE